MEVLRILSIWSSWVALSLGFRMADDVVDWISPNIGVDFLCYILCKKVLVSSEGRFMILSIFAVLVKQETKV